MIAAALTIAVAAGLPASSSSSSAGCYGTCSTKAERRLAERVIRRTFGRYGSQAVAVARCESNLDVRAYNGQYRGLFQMGSAERRRFGHHPTSPYAQATAARRYFDLAGRDWSPWSCKPWHR